jgi:hypothetical protein
MTDHMQTMHEGMAMMPAPMNMPKKGDAAIDK